MQDFCLTAVPITLTVQCVCNLSEDGLTQLRTRKAELEEQQKTSMIQILRLNGELKSVKDERNKLTSKSSICAQMTD